MSVGSIDVYKEWLGIPEGERPPDHYQLLRLVQFEDDPEKIRKHYKKLNTHVRKYASGQFSVQSQELLNELARAMLVLTDAERKKEYDRSLGRELGEEADHRRSLGEVLIEQGHLSAAQLEEARHYSERTGLSLRDALVQMKLVEPNAAAQALAEDLGLSYVDLPDLIPDDSVLDRVPRNVVKRNSCLPLFVDDDAVLVACPDQPTTELEDEIRLRFDRPMRAVIATPLAINQGIAKYYAPGARDEAAAEAAIAGKTGKKTSKSTSGAAKPRKQKQPARQLTEGEKAQRRQIGILIACWSVILPVLIDLFVLVPWFRITPPFGLVSTYVLAPVGIAFAWFAFIKR